MEKGRLNRFVRFREGEADIDLLFDNIEKYMFLLMTSDGVGILGLFVGESKESVIEGLFSYIKKNSIFTCTQHTDFIELNIWAKKENDLLIYITGFKNDVTFLEGKCDHFLKCDGCWRCGNEEEEENINLEF